MQRVSLPPIGTAKAWREAARGFLAAGVPPEDILWGDHAAVPDLFGGETVSPKGGQVSVPRSFVSMAETAASQPLFPALLPARSIACSSVSVVSTPKLTGTPPLRAVLAMPLAAAAAR